MVCCTRLFMFFTICSNHTFSQNHQICGTFACCFRRPMDSLYNRSVFQISTEKTSSLSGRAKVFIRRSDSVEIGSRLIGKRRCDDNGGAILSRFREEFGLCLNSKLLRCTLTSSVSTFRMEDFKGKERLSRAGLLYEDVASVRALSMICSVVRYSDFVFDFSGVFSSSKRSIGSLSMTVLIICLTMDCLTIGE